MPEEQPKKQTQLESLLDLIANPDAFESDVSKAIYELKMLRDARAVVPLKELSVRRQSLYRQAREAMASIRDAWLVSRYNRIRGMPIHLLNPVDRIVRKLRNFWGRVRPGKVRELGQTGDERALPYLLLLAVYGAPEVRAAAVFGLNLLKHKDAVPVLVSALSDESSEVAAVAEMALVKMGDEAVEPLIKVVSTSRGVSCIRAINMLGEIRNERAIPCLIRCLKGGNKFIADAAVRALSKMWSGAVEPLLHLLISTNHDVRLNAAKALAAHMDVRAIPYMIDCLNDQGPGVEEIKEIARKVLLDFEEKSFEPLMAALTSEDVIMRREVLEVVKWYKDDGFREQLLKMAGDPDQIVRQKVIEALAMCGGRETTETLIRALSDPEPGVRRAAASGFKGEPPGEAFDALVRGLEDEDKAVRADCVEALSRLKDTRAAKPLALLLWDPDPEVRVKTVKALNHIIHRDTIEWIAGRTAAGEFTIESLEALAAAGDSRAIPLIINEFKWERMSDLRMRKAVNAVIVQNRQRRSPQYCMKCFCWSRKFRGYNEYHPDTFSWRSKIYYACRICHGNFPLEPGIKQVKLVLDLNMQELTQKEGAVLRINGLKTDNLCEIDELHVLNAPDADVERWVMKFKNDSDEERLKRLSQIIVYLSNRCELSQSKVNLLRDNFKVKMFNP